MKRFFILLMHKVKCVYGNVRKAQLWIEGSDEVLTIVLTKTSSKKILLDLLAYERLKKRYSKKRG